VASATGGGQFRVEVDGADVTGSIAVNNTMNSWTAWTTVTRNGVTLPAGQHVLRVFVIAGNFNLNSMTFATGAYTGTPFGGTRASLPGTVQAENFDEGGESVAYHDSDAVNQGTTTTRAAGSPGVDLQPTTDTGGGVNVGWIATDEWLRYSVNVTTAGTYTVSFRVASMSGGGSIRMEVDGIDVTGAVAVASTGGWQTWATVTRPGVNFTAGQHLVRIYMVNTGFNLNSFTVQ
jgi:hypothetical protein